MAPDRDIRSSFDGTFPRARVEVVSRGFSTLETLPVGRRR
jgi:hypothetical protein